MALLMSLAALVAPSSSIIAFVLRLVQIPVVGAICTQNGRCDVVNNSLISFEHASQDQILLQMNHKTGDCAPAQIRRRRRNTGMCSCRRRSGFSDNGWKCKGDAMVRVSPLWADEFDDTTGDGSLNRSKWNFYLGPNHHNQELQYYTDRLDNAYVQSGSLKIVAKCERYGGMRYTSAYVKSQNMGDWGPGHRIEIRAKLPWGKGSWPALWMLPTDMAYGGWPDSGEIDIMEAVGCTPGTIYGTVHTGRYNHMRNTQVFGKSYLDFTKWHTYSIDWTDSSIKWFVDGNHYHTFAPDTSRSSKWPFDQRFFLILNVAVGGTWGGFCAGRPSCSRSSHFGKDQVMEVDYVRIYCLDGTQSCKTERYSCCSHCDGRAACSPRSGRCYDAKAKDYYESCTNALIQDSHTNEEFEVEGYSTVHGGLAALQ